jgi:sec-independent protein translocase protein TatC
MTEIKKLRPARPVDEGGTMSLMEHLRELRSRLVKAALAVTVAAVAVYFFMYDSAYNLATAPYCEAVKGSHQKSCDLLFLSLTDAWMTKMRISGQLGLMFALPIVFWQLWRFIAPGLYRKERRYGIGFVSISVALFSLGAVFAYYSLPPIFRWFIDEAGSATLQNKAEDYFSLFTLMILAFGVCFELPLVLVALQWMGVLQPTTLARRRRETYVGIIVFVAILTPGGDPISLVLLSGALIVFFEISLLIGRMIVRRKA